MTTDIYRLLYVFDLSNIFILLAGSQCPAVLLLSCSSLSRLSRQIRQRSMILDSVVPAAVPSAGTSTLVVFVEVETAKVD